MKRLPLGELLGQIANRFRDVYKSRAERVKNPDVGSLGTLLQIDTVVGEIASDGHQFFSIKCHARTLSGVSR